jgi:hypothetical protein
VANDVFESCCDGKHTDFECLLSVARLTFRSLPFMIQMMITLKIQAMKNITVYQGIAFPACKVQRRFGVVPN